jgi:hypothetical protein
VSQSYLVYPCKELKLNSSLNFPLEGLALCSVKIPCTVLLTLMGSLKTTVLSAPYIGATYFFFWFALLFCPEDSVSRFSSNVSKDLPEESKVRYKKVR